MGIPTLRSPSIPNGGLIPNRHTATGPGLSPALIWRRPPRGRIYLTIVARSWRITGGDEVVHWLIFDAFSFLGGLAEDAGQGAGWTTGVNSDGDARFLPFSGVEPRRVAFEMFATRAPTGLDEPTDWAEISRWLGSQDARGPYGFTAYDADLPALLGALT